MHVASDAADHSRVFALKRIVCHDKAALADAVAEMELLSCLPPHANIIRFRAGTQRTLCVLLMCCLCVANVLLMCC